MRISKKDILYFFIIVALFKPYCIPTLYGGSFADILYDLMKIVILFLAVLYFLITNKKNIIKNNMFVVCALIYQAGMLYASYRVENLYGRIGVLINCISVVIVILCLLSNDLVCTLKCFSYVLLIYPYGLNNEVIPEARINFLGMDNNYIVWALISLFCTHCYKSLTGKAWLAYYISISVNTVFLILSSSSTGKFVWILILIAVFFESIKKVVTKIRPEFIIVFFSLLYIGIIIYNIQFYFENMIETIFNKRGDFSSRIIIWETMKSTIAKNPVWGIGQSIVKIQGWYEREAYAHNLVLDIMMKGGTVSICLFVVVLLCWCLNAKKLIKNK